MGTTPTPLFIFSLPRSGSTLLQRMLGSHPQIATEAEPWLLLPLIYMTKPDGVFAEYAHQHSNRAIRDFAECLPEGHARYEEHLRSFVCALYEDARDATEPGARYFLDKTPRYCLIADEIIDLFPEGRFIFLFRNPLSIIASQLQTRTKGKWSVYTRKVMLFDGLERLINAYRCHQDRVVAIQYERLVADAARTLEEVSDYLGVDFDPGAVTHFNDVAFKGRMGDPVGPRKYKTVSSEPIEKWRNILNNPLRKRWCRRYLHWLGRERLETMGYELEALLAELDSVPSTAHHLLGDLYRMPLGALYCALDLPVLKSKFVPRKPWHRVVGHY